MNTAAMNNPPSSTTAIVRRPIEATPRDPAKHKTYFGAISQGRSKGGEYVDAFKMVLCGFDPEANIVARQSPEAASLVAQMTSMTTRDVVAFLADPEWFLAHWPVEDERVQLYGMVTGLLEIGQNIEPAAAERVGDYFVIRNGRHRTAVQRFVVAVLDGECPVPACLRAEFNKVRADRGLDWRPMLTALPPVDDARTGKAMDALAFAELSQVVRVTTDVELFSRAMARVNAARAQGKVPDYEAIGRNYRVTGSRVRDWERLAGMDEQVRQLVLDPPQGARPFPLQSALTFAALPPEEQRASVMAMVEAGDTRTATARATARAARQEAAEPRADAPAPAAATDGDSEAATKAADPPAQHDADPPRPRKPTVVRPGWGVRELKKFLSVATAAERPNPTLRALHALMTVGPDSIDAVTLHAVPGLAEFLRAESEASR